MAPRICASARIGVSATARYTFRERTEKGTYVLHEHIVRCILSCFDHSARALPATTGHSFRSCFDLARRSTRIMSDSCATGLGSQAVARERVPRHRRSWLQWWRGRNILCDNDFAVFDVAQYVPCVQVLETWIGHACHIPRPAIMQAENEMS